jgi:hypothetical protein
MVDPVGLIANIIEATVSWPMFYRIVIQKQIENISVVLKFQYIMKIGLFWITKVPSCFIFRASWQLCVDIITLLSLCRLRRVNQRKETLSVNGADGRRDEQNPPVLSLSRVLLRLFEHAMIKMDPKSCKCAFLNQRDCEQIVSSLTAFMKWSGFTSHRIHEASRSLPIPR